MRLEVSLLIALLMAGSQAATPPDSAPSERFQCDASADSEPPLWKKELTAFPAHVSGTFEMLELKSYRQWPPMVQVYIDTPDSESRGFSIHWLPEENGGPAIVWFPIWETAASAPKGSPWRATGVIPFDIAIAEDGKVSFRVNDVVRGAWVDVTRPLTLQLTCITSKVDFSSIRIR
jgi:hypothetical protein